MKQNTGFRSDFYEEIVSACIPNILQEPFRTKRAAVERHYKRIYELGEAK